MSFTKFLLAHFLHWAVLYGAFVVGIEGAMYVLKFGVWLMAPASLFLLSDKSVQLSAKRPPTPIRSTLSVIQAWVTLALLVWFGHVVSAVAWGLVMTLAAWHKGATIKARAAAAT